MAKNVAAGESGFTGGAFENFFRSWVVGFVSVITLSLAYPAMRCWKLRWECDNTYYDGKRLVFDGKGGQLFGLYIKWLLLSVITLGIYYIVCARVSMAKWETKHTHFAGEEDVESEFDGKWYQLLGVNILTAFVTLITLSLGIYWAHCYQIRWLCGHRTISGQRMYFDGQAIQFFGKCILWTLLTIITLTIYSFWFTVKAMDWTASHTHIENRV